MGSEMCIRDSPKPFPGLCQHNSGKMPRMSTGRPRNASEQTLGCTGDLPDRAGPVPGRSEIMSGRYRCRQGQFRDRLGAALGSSLDCLRINPGRSLDRPGTTPRRSRTVPGPSWDRTGNIAEQSLDRPGIASGRFRSADRPRIARNNSWTPPRQSRESRGAIPGPVSYTHLTLPTKRIV